MAGKYLKARTTSVSLAALLIGVGAGTSAFAQDNDGDSWLDLGQITLFGSGLETTVMESPASVTVIDQETIERIPAQTIGDLLRTVPGLRIDDGSFERVIIRGEGGNRVLIKIDGQALTDHNGMGLGTPILVDPATVERIEVIRGSASVVGGTRAIGGVVNIITKKGGDKPFGGSFSVSHFSATEGYRTNLSLYGKQGGFDYRLSFGKADLGNVKTPDGELVPSDFQQNNISAHLGYTLGNHYFAMKLQNLDMATNVYIAGLPPTMAMTIALPKRDLTKRGFHYEGTDITPWMSKLTGSLYHQTVDREFAVDRVMFGMGSGSASSDEQTTQGFNVDAVLKFAHGHRTKIGMEYEDDYVDTFKTSYGPFGPGLSTHNKARIKTLSIYALHEADINDRLTAFLGARHYNVDADLEFSTNRALTANSDDRLLGSAALVWKASDQLALRVSLSQGYTYPNLTQMFITTTAGRVVTHGNPDLLPEKSNTAEIGARFDGGAAVIDATLFYTEAKDYIGRAPDPANPGADTYINVNEAKTFGFELYAERAIEGTSLTPYISATWMRRSLSTVGYNSDTPEIFGKIGVRYDWQLRNGIAGSLNAYIEGEGEVYGVRRGVVTKTAAGYATFNIAADAELRENLHLVASFNNLFNKSYAPRGSLPGAERNVKLNLTWRF